MSQYPPEPTSDFAAAPWLVAAIVFAPSVIFVVWLIIVFATSGRPDWMRP